MADRLTLICLALWSLLFGLFSVTSIKMDWGKEIMGYAALILGIVCAVRVIIGYRQAKPPP